MTALVWAVKQSLIGYVRGMQDGRITTDRGAHESLDGFVFPGEGRVFSGRVTFAGHSGMMRVVLADPSLVPRGDSWMLEIADPDDDALRLPFAGVASFDGSTGSDVTLTAEGADLFFGPYTEGTPLADFTVHD